VKRAHFDYEEVLASASVHAKSTDPFADWDRRVNNLPSRALGLLDSALLYMFCSMPSKIVQTFLRGCIEVAERVIREQRFAQAPNEADPYLLATGKHRVHRAHAFGCAIRDSAWPDAGEISVVIENQVAATREFAKKADWDVLQSIYLCAVELELINGKPERAHELLRKRYSFKGSRPRHEALLHLCEGILGETSAKPEADAYADFQAFFDTRRMPGGGPPVSKSEREWTVYDEKQVQALQMAMIKHQYIDGKGPSPDWTRIVNLVTA
jgi:hypothetical protein